MEGVFRWRSIIMRCRQSNEGASHRISNVTLEKKWYVTLLEGGNTHFLRISLIEWVTLSRPIRYEYTLATPGP